MYNNHVRVTSLWLANGMKASGHSPLLGGTSHEVASASNRVKCVELKIEMNGHFPCRVDKKIEIDETSTTHSLIESPEYEERISFIYRCRRDGTRHQFPSGGGADAVRNPFRGDVCLGFCLGIKLVQQGCAHRLPALEKHSLQESPPYRYVGDVGRKRVAKSWGDSSEEFSSAVV